MTLTRKLRAVARAATPSPVRKKIRDIRDYRINKEAAAIYREIAEKEGHKFGEISFGPRLPLIENDSVLPKLCAELGWAVEPYTQTNPTRRTVFWPRSEDIFPSQPVHWINGRCGNINKSFVAKATAEAFGFSYVVDPTTHHGSMVSKGDRNAGHDGRVINGPTAPEGGRFYMRTINNIHDDMVEDIRVIFMRKILPFAYLKYRPLAHRFSNTNSRAELVDTSSIMTASEILKLEDACRRIGMDYGEIDCLRDLDDGRLYAIDMNRTPAGPPNGLPSEQYKRAIKVMAPIFAETFR